jgi:hypothetical protein
MAGHCGGSGGGGGSSQGPANNTSGGTNVVNTPNGQTLTPESGSNVMTVTVGGPSAQYINEPTVSVTICDASGANCQTIGNILLDSGDYGLRVYEQVLSSTLAAALRPVQVNGLPLYECIEYGDGSSIWGPVESATVTLGGERPVSIPIHVIGPASFNSSTVCRGTPLLATPADAGFNGALGIGFFPQDCGSACASAAQNGVYFTCSGSICTGTAVPVAEQSQNAVSALPTDNNGVLLRFPSVPAAGAQVATGYLIFGIGTQSNNSPSGFTAYPADNNPADLSYGRFTTTYNGTSYTSFLDTGSNGLFFPSSQIPTADNGTWYNPPSLLTQQATTVGYPSGPSGQVTFEVGNFDSLSASSNTVFSDLAGPGPGGSMFDWGLPFFLGRNVFIGFEGASSVLGTGPFWAY